MRPGSSKRSAALSPLSCFDLSVELSLAQEVFFFSFFFSGGIDFFCLLSFFHLCLGVSVALSTDRRLIKNKPTHPTVTIRHFPIFKMPLQHFHRFLDLPREVQLLIWEFHETDNFPHFIHYFRRMIVYSGRLYAAADKSSGWLADTLASPGGPTETEVPDPAVTPHSKIRLIGNIHWLSSDQMPTPTRFSTIQSPRPGPSESHAWVNFKHDTFSFVNANSARFDDGFLDYFKEDVDLIMPRQASSGTLDSRAHWFFRIQNLALIVQHEQGQLGAFDRLLLANHPSLRSVTLITRMFRFSCHCCGDHDPGPAFHQLGDMAKRIPLDEFVAVLAAARSGDCESVIQSVNELRALRQELVDLLGQSQRQDAQGSRAPTVHIEVELYCNKQPAVQQKVNAARASLEEMA